VRRQGSPFHLAWSQLTRDRLRFAVAVAGVTFAVVLMLVQLGFRRALFRSSVRIQERLNGQVVLISPQSSYIVQMRSFPRRRLEQALATPGVAAVSPLYMSLAFWENPEGGLPRHIFLLGIDPEADVLDMPELRAQSSLLKIRDVALFDSASRPEYGAVAERLARDGRAEVEVNDHRLEIRGVFRMGTSFGIDGTVITSHVPNDVLVLTKEDYIRREIAYWTKVTPIGVIFGFGVMIGFGVGAIIVSQILFSDVSDHLPEYATLKAIGYGNLYLYGVVLSEAIILAVLGYLPGLLAALALYRAAAQATMLPMEMAPSMAALVLGLTVSMCSLAGILALRKLQRADPAEIF
jgi:putative ABC transport system permease protein